MTLNSWPFSLYLVSPKITEDYSVHSSPLPVVLIIHNLHNLHNSLMVNGAEHTINAFLFKCIFYLNEYSLIYKLSCKYSFSIQGTNSSSDIWFDFFPPVRGCGFSLSSHFLNNVFEKHFLKYSYTLYSFPLVLYTLVICLNSNWPTKYHKGLCLCFSKSFIGFYLLYCLWPILN